MAFKMNQHWTGPMRPRLTRPELLGCYSFDDNQLKDSSLAQLKYFYDPELNPVEFDLNDGFENTDKALFGHDIRNIDRVLNWLSINSSCVTASPEEDRWLEPHFISNRRSFALLLRAFYQKRNDWILCACKFRGSIYLNSLSTDRYTKEREERNEEQIRFSYWGRKFEKYLLTNDPHKPPNTSESVKDEEFACVYKTWLGNHSLLYGAQIDGATAQEVVTDLEQFKRTKFIDIKTNRILETEKHEHTLRRWKSLTWWSNNIVTGPEHVVCGFRDDDGIVKSVTKYTLRDILALGEDHWNRTVCLNFCSSFLSHVQSVVTRDYDECVYKFEYIPTPHDATPRVPPVVNMTELESASESFDRYSFLPTWYIEKCNELSG